ncbi:MAG: DUF5658 family protein [Candidatus Bathyarchaeia archaeon]|jgi:hypothetical protein
MLQLRTHPSVVLVAMGSMDLLTTMVGVVYFGAVECNPLLAGILSTNLTSFIALKAAATVFAGLLFYQAGKLLTKTQNKTAKAYRVTQRLLRAAYLGIAGFMLTVLVNNMLVLAGVI